MFATRKGEFITALMMEPKVQAFVTWVCGGCKVVGLFFRSHGIPYHCSSFVTPDIVRLDSKEQGYIEDAYSNQDLVATTIWRRVICLIDVGRDNASKLHHHVVDGSTDCSGSDCIWIDWVPSNQDRMAWWWEVWLEHGCYSRFETTILWLTVWVPNEQRNNGKLYPCIGISRYHFQGDQKGQSPDGWKHSS